MSGLGTVKEGGRSTYLSIAGGYIWNRKAESNDPNYATQGFDRADGTKGERAGARYQDLTGIVTDVMFRTHTQYGENVNVTISAGGDSFILSVSTNNRYSQDIMKMLLIADLNLPVYIKPYDFTDKDGRRAQGVSFRQNGEKISLRVDGAPNKEKEWFKTAGPKNIKRFFEDLSDWYVNQVTTTVNVGQAPAVAPVAAPVVEAPVVAAPVVETSMDDARFSVAQVSDLDSELDNLLG